MIPYFNSTLVRELTRFPRVPVILFNPLFYSLLGWSGTMLPQEYPGSIPIPNLSYFRPGYGIQYSHSGVAA